MARQGLLGQAKPAGTTNTLLYAAPIDSSASTVLTVAADGGADTYDVALKDYDQRLTLDASTYKLHEGDVVTGYRFNLGTNIPAASALTAGQVLTSADGEKKAVFESFYIEPFTTIYVKELGIRSVTVNSVVGTFAVGETVTKGSGGNTATATIYGVAQGSGTTSIYIGPTTLAGTGTEFTDSDGITSSGGATASISTGGVGAAVNEFILSTDDVTYNLYLGVDLEVFTDRTYRFDVSDSSMSGIDFRLSTTVNGEWGPDNIAGSADDGAQLTTGKTTNGTPGQSGAYIQYDFSAGALSGNLYFYEGDTGTAGNFAYGGNDRYLVTSTEFTYSGVYIYDKEGTWVDGTDTFEANGVAYTVQTQTAGAYGYVRDLSGATLKVIKGKNSADFTTSSVFQDSPILTTASRAAVGVSAVLLATTAADAEMFLRKDNAIGDDNTEEIKSLVVGPGQRVIVESNGGNAAFNLVGFEDASSALTVRNFGSGVGNGGGSGGGS